MSEGQPLPGDHARLWDALREKPLVVPFARADRSSRPCTGRPAAVRERNRGTVQQPPPAIRPVAGLPRLDQVLTPRLLAVADQVAAAHDNAAIARALGLSYATVKTYVTDILDALDLDNRYQLMLVAIAQDRVDVGARVAEIAAEAARRIACGDYTW